MSASGGDPWAYVDAEIAALSQADAAAERVAAEFNRARSSHRLTPEVVVRRCAGPEDGPVYDFRVNVELPDDLAPSEYPMDEVQQLASALRSEVATTDVTRWRWLVSIGTKAGTRRR